MVIVWQRLGFLALVIPAVSVGVCRHCFPTDSTSVAKGLGSLTAPGTGWGLLAAALILWPLGVWLNWPVRQSEYDPASGQLVTVNSPGQHKLYWLRIQYWAFVWAVLGVYCLVGG